MKKKAILCILVLVLCGCHTSKMPKASEHRILNKEEEIKNAWFSLTLQEADRIKEIAPEEPEKYYHLYEEVEGYIYYRIKGNITNQSEHILEIDSLYTQIVVDATNYEGRIRLERADKKDLTTTLEKDQTLTCYLFYLLPETETKPPKEIDMFFNTRLQKESENTYDYAITIVL